MEYIEARWFNRSVLRQQVDLIVVHSAETDRGPGKARAVAKWFAGPGAPKASAHWVCDDRDVISCVPSERIAYHAPGANSVGVGLELAGRADQTRREWTDRYGSAVLWNGAAAASFDAHRYSIPVQLVDVEALRAFYPPGDRAYAPNRARGFTTHAMVTEAFGRSDHVDPGPGFPLDEFLELVKVSLRLERWRALL